MSTPRRKRVGSKGTGFAQPKGTPSIGNSSVPIGSMWEIGFSVSRPCRSAVSSPKR
jgi:hypothetical protein